MQGKIRKFWRRVDFLLISIFLADSFLIKNFWLHIEIFLSQWEIHIFWV